VQTKLLAERLLQVAKLEQISLEPASAMGLANLANGSLRDGLNYLQEAALVGNNQVNEGLLRETFGQPERSVVLSMVRLVVEGNAAALLLAADDLIRHGADVRSVLLGISETFRDAMVLETGAETLADVTPEEKEILKELLKKLSRTCLINIAKLLGRIDKEIELNINPRLVLEAALLHCISYVAQDAAKKSIKP
jgi:DNA polymerase III gamma/tau subunit